MQQSSRRYHSGRTCAVTGANQTSNKRRLKDKGTIGKLTQYPMYFPHCAMAHHKLQHTATTAVEIKRQLHVIEHIELHTLLTGEKASLWPKRSASHQTLWGTGWWLWRSRLSVPLLEDTIQNATVTGQAVPCSR